MELINFDFCDLNLITSSSSQAFTD